MLLVCLSAILVSGFVLSTVLYDLHALSSPRPQVGNLVVGNTRPLRSFPSLLVVLHSLRKFTGKSFNGEISQMSSVNGCHHSEWYLLMKALRSGLSLKKQTLRLLVERVSTTLSTHGNPL